MSKKLWVKVLVAALILLLAIILLWGIRTRLQKKPVEKSSFLFGTLIRITAYGPNTSSALEAAFREMSRIHQLVDAEVGELAQINKNAGRSPVPVNAELFTFLEEVFQLAQASEGYFNPVIGALVDLWDFGYQGKGRLPSVQEIQSVLPLTQSALVKFDPEKQTVFLPQAGMKLDLGGVAKGYALDRAWEILRASGVRGALLNGGESSIRVLGERPGGGPWRVALSHPRHADWIGIIKLNSGQAIGTSADTQRYFEVDGRRYSHLLNPYTGYPPADLFAAIVIAETAFEADLYSTAVFAAEGREREEYLAERGLEGVLVDAGQQIIMTPAVEKMLLD
ncbi:MAG: FAD:protein FMN transferase [Firmicutes bacterium]|nr:FAD:protein FMN transferase [Bacillota bacterium]